MPHIEDIEHRDYQSLFDNPLSQSRNIWRYIDIGQFLSLMYRSALHFTRADLFEDEFEGSIPAPNHLPERLRGFYRRNSEITNISCWNVSENESMLMWNSNPDQTVAIQSTVGRLRTSFQDFDDYAIHFAKVDYVDFDTIPFRSFEKTDDGGYRGNYLEPFQYKRPYFEGEEEFRAFSSPIASESFREKVEKEEMDFTWGEVIEKYSQPSLFIEVKIEELVKEVVVSPNAPSTMTKSVKDIAERYHSIGDRVTESVLS